MTPFAAMMVSAAWAGTATIDLSSQVPAAAAVAAHTHGACENRRDQVLEVAVVVYGRMRGRSTWGHISLRFLACAAGQFRDVEFEATRMDASLVDWFAAAHPEEGWYHMPDFLNVQRDRLVLFRNEHPVDGGTYAEELDKNREITEFWLPIDRDEAAAVLTELDAAFETQLAALRSGHTVSRPRYRAMALNCTEPVLRLTTAAAPTALQVGSLYPLTWLRNLEDEPTVRVVVHPSPHVLRSIEVQTGDLKAAWSGAPSEVYRPLVRRRLPNERLEAFRARISMDAAPIGVMWALEARSEPGSDRP